MRKVRAGIIGCGGLGKVHTESVSRIDGLDMVAYCDVFEDKAKGLLDQFGGDYATTDPERLFRDESLDAIYVTTLHDTHAELCVRGLDADGLYATLMVLQAFESLKSGKPEPVRSVVEHVN